jgi:Flp pilus assembly pilin Flp
MPHRSEERDATEMNISDWLEFVRTNWKKDEGQTMAEYGVVLAVITVLIIGVLGTLSGKVQDQLQSVVNIL